jgi:hypothetical protein
MDLFCISATKETLLSSLPSDSRESVSAFMEHTLDFPVSMGSWVIIGNPASTKNNAAIINIVKEQENYFVAVDKKHIKRIHKDHAFVFGVLSSAAQLIWLFGGGALFFFHTSKFNRQN